MNGNITKVPENKKKEPLFSVGGMLEWLEILVLSISIVFLLFTFISRVAVVDGDSMKETLHNGEVLLVSNIFYTPKQGDIVVLQTEAPEFGLDLGRPIVKRVIATEGQTIDIDYDNWIVYIDGEPLKEDYVNKVYLTPDLLVKMKSWAYGESYVVPEHCVFVMGDNRNESCDSRYFGAVDSRYIVGKVLFRVSPFDRFGAIH